MLTRNNWESTFFAKEVYSLDLNKWNFSEFRTQVAQAEPELIEAKVPLEEVSIISEMVAEGFYIADATLDFVKRIKNVQEEGSVTIECAGTGLIEDVRYIAQESIVLSRFDDNVFGENAKQRVYMEWVSNAVAGDFDDVCLVSRVDSQVAGFVTCRKEAGRRCRVGLLAVATVFQGRGVGGELLNAAVRYTKDQQCDVLKISTQYANRPAIGLYSKAGFIIDSIDLWLYRT